LQRSRASYEGLDTRHIGLKCERGCLVGNLSAQLANQRELIRDRLQQTYARWTGDIETAIRDGHAGGGISATFPAEELASFLVDADESAVLRARRNILASIRCVHVDGIWQTPRLTGPGFLRHKKSRNHAGFSVLRVTGSEPFEWCRR